MNDVEFLKFEDSKTRDFFRCFSYLSEAYLELFSHCGDGFCFVHSSRYPVSLPGIWVQSDNGIFLNAYPWYSMWGELWLKDDSLTTTLIRDAWLDIQRIIRKYFRNAVIVDRPWSKWLPPQAHTANRLFYYIPDTTSAHLLYGRSTRQKLNQVEKRGICVRELSSLKEFSFIDNFLKYYASRGIKTKPSSFWEVVENRLSQDFQAVVALRNDDLLAGTVGAHLKNGTMAEGSFLMRRDKECSVGMAAILDYSIRNARKQTFIFGSNAPELSGVSYFKNDFGCKEIPYDYCVLGAPLTSECLDKLMKRYPYFYFFPRDLCTETDYAQ